MMKTTRRNLSLLLTATLLFTLLPFVTITAHAETSLNINSASITISQAGNYYIAGTGSTTGNTINVNANIVGDVNITISNINIQTSDMFGATSFLIGSGTVVNLTLTNSNTLSTGAFYQPSLGVPTGATLNVTAESTGTLVALGGVSGPGIGGVGSGGNSGTIRIGGGTITATSRPGGGVGGAGAGIGGSNGGNGGTVDISGGIVMANGLDGGAGIGGGSGGSGGTIVISGGIVKAVSSRGGAGIGGGTANYTGSNGGSGGMVSITGGTVEATGGSTGVGIGSGRSEDGGMVGATGTTYISGSSVNATISGTVYNNSQAMIPVYMTKVQGLPNNSTVACNIGDGNIFSCETDSTGDVYLWLPAGDCVVDITLGSTRYGTKGVIGSEGLNFLIMNGKFSIETSALPAGSVGTSYNVILSAYGNPCTWSTESELPDGLSLSADGILSGIPTEVGVYPIEVSAADGTEILKRVLTLSIYDTVSTGLTGLSVTDGSGGPLVINPSFDREMVVYSVTTGSAVNSIVVTATMADTTSTLSINDQVVTSGTPVAVSLENGANLIPVTLTALGGLSQKSYILSVNGTVSNANLAGISISEGELLFDAEDTSYSIAVNSAVAFIDITASAVDSKAIMLLNGAILPQGGTKRVSLSAGANTVPLMVVAQDATLKTYTLTVTRKEIMSITTENLPAGIVGSTYSGKMVATGGSGSYVWSWAALTGSSLPSSITLTPDGTLQMVGTLTAGDIGTHQVEITVADSETPAVVEKKTFVLTIRNGSGNGAFLIESDGDAAYVGSYTADGIPMLTVKPGVSGFTYIGVKIAPVNGHAGTEICVFVQTRGGQQINMSAAKGDFETLTGANAAFNVKAGDVIQIYLVDNLSNNGVSPNIL